MNLETRGRPARSEAARMTRDGSPAPWSSPPQPSCVAGDPLPFKPTDPRSLLRLDAASRCNKTQAELKYIAEFATELVQGLDGNDAEEGYFRINMMRATRGEAVTSARCRVDQFCSTWLAILISEFCEKENPDIKETPRAGPDWGWQAPASSDARRSARCARCLDCEAG
jgi:hypothetical protein